MKNNERTNIEKDIEASLIKAFPGFVFTREVETDWFNEGITDNKKDTIIKESNYNLKDEFFQECKLLNKQIYKKEKSDNVDDKLLSKDLNLDIKYLKIERKSDEDKNNNINPLDKYLLF